MNKGILYVVATPIGNLGDITLRALETLKSIDYIACEDTRVTSKLLNHYSIQKTLISYHQHSELKKIDLIINKLKEGMSIALVTDAGTPGVSDPGNILVAEAIKNDVEIQSIPGPSALGALISIAGIDLQKFLFLGFPPHKKGRETFFKEVIESKYPVIYYESPHRFIKNLELLKLLECQKRIIIGRELTKVFEQVIRGDVNEILAYFEKNQDKIKGEFVVVIDKK